MYREISGNPFCPGSFPFRQNTESPLNRSEYREHAQQNLLAEDGTPPAYSEDDHGEEHNYFVQSYHQSHKGGIVFSFCCLFGYLYRISSSCTFSKCFLTLAVCDVLGCCIPIFFHISTHGITLVYQRQQFIVFITHLYRLCFIEVVRVRTDTVRYVGEGIQDTCIGTSSDTTLARWVPKTHHQSYTQDLHDFENIDRLVLYHHLIGDTSCYDDTEECAQSHAHLQDPPEGTV